MNEVLTMNSNAELLLNTTLDAGDYKLQVSGNVYGSGSASFGGAAYSGRALTAYANGTDYGMTLQQNNASGLGLQIFRNGASWGGTPFNIQTSSSTLFTVTSTGSVGIGTASPSERFHVQGSGDIKSMIESTTSGSGANSTLTFKTATEGTWLLQTGNAVSGGFRVYDGVAAAERYRVNSSGEILVNSTSDQGDYKLQINGNQYTTGTAALAQVTGEILVRGTNNPFADVNRGNITLNGAVSNIVAFTNGTSTTGYLFHTNTDMQLFNANATGNMRFFTNSTEYMRLRPDGELLLNTTTDAGDYKLQVSGNAYVTGTTVLAASSGNVGVGTASTSTYTNQTGTLVVLSTNDGTIGDGNLHLYSSSPQNTNIGGALVFGGQDGVVIPRTFASIAGLKENNTSGNYSSYLRFGTRENGFSVTEKMRITSVGIVAIGTNSPNASAQLDVTSTTRGFLPPRMTTTQRDAISSPAAGLVIYNTTTSKLQVYTTAWTDLH
jgi:hypothetical protein